MIHSFFKFAGCHKTLIIAITIRPMPFTIIKLKIPVLISLLIADKFPTIS